MDAINPSQQDNWENNIYLLTTTRILMALGLTFLVRSVYQLYQRMRTPSRSTGAPVPRAEEAIGIDLEALTLGALGDVASFGSGPMDGINETVEIALPQPVYSPAANCNWGASERGGPGGETGGVAEYVGVVGWVQDNGPDTFMNWDWDEAQEMGREKRPANPWVAVIDPT
ncbi:MAG: hypothetical protein ASARMPREDX12_007127 [Alectoria sarmentosa]|nr:MAG: hypothetical protein ASARMPRED_006848 [Alectoria sarmentosa]CAD6593396.1 MAG: hypothetical protein ASARMPREDX12_007127 [Alectoria sarmentosa]